MITNTKQNWAEGQTVKVGFLTLIVRMVRGNEYTLQSLDGRKLFLFVPHCGLVRLS